MWSPALQIVNIAAVIAACPEAKAKAPTPFSSIAILFSKAATVGLLSLE